MPTLFEKCERIVYGSAEKYIYVHRKDSTTTAAFSPKQLDILTITEEHTKRYKNTNLQNAALAYHISANLRVYLNAPETKEYQKEIEKCEAFIKNNRKTVLSDKRVRKKTKIALHIFTLGRRPFKIFYHIANMVTGKVENG